MRYKPNQKTGLVLFFLLTLLFVMLLVTKKSELFASGSGGFTQALLLVLVYLLAAGLLYWKYGLVKAIRLDEQGLTVERRGASDVSIPFQELTRVTYRSGQKRGVAGLMLERGEDRAPQFLLLNGFTGEEVERLCQELERQLGPRFESDLMERR